MKIAYIGAGSASLLSALYVKSLKPDYQVTIYEKTAKLGRKIAASGNGKGNLTNLNVAPNKYNNPTFVTPFLAYTPEMFINFMQKHGLITRVDEEGRVYPYGESATIVVDLLKAKLALLGVDIRLNTEVTSITKTDAFLINGKDVYDVVVIATGSPAGLSPSLVSTALKPVLNYFDIHMSRLYPTLASVGVQEKVKLLSGKRLRATIRALVDNKEIYTTSGEVLFRDNALSGIAIFECSSLLTWAYRTNPKVSGQLLIDFAPDLLEMDLKKTIANLLNANKGLANPLTGLFSDVINDYVYNLIPKTERSAERLAHTIKNVPFTVDFDYIPDNNQVYSGGIRLNEVNPKTLESVRVNNLFFAGEVLDIDGLCGGYNLHWAWSSGYAVAQAIIRL